MMQKIKYQAFVIICFQVFSFNLFAESLPRETIITQVSEHYILPGEDLWFSVMVSNEKELPGKQISNLAFVEFMDAENRSIVRKKILLDKGVGSGGISVPDSLSSGNYFLVVYTAWMKNFGPETFSVSKIMVVKPGDKIQEIVRSGPAVESTISRAPLFVGVELDKTKFSARNKVAVRLSTEITDSAVIAVSVRKKEPAFYPHKGSEAETNWQQTAEQIRYLPDYKGIVLSGSIRNKLDNEPLPNHPVYLSFPGTYVEIKHTTSDENGTFHFLLDTETGEKDMVFNLGAENAGIWLDDRFSKKPFQFSMNRPFALNNEQLDYFTQKYINRQLMEKYRQNQREANFAAQQKQKEPFYGQPYQNLIFDEFIRLDSLHEYFYELLPTVHINRKNKKYSMHLTDPATNYRVGDNPALFVDGVFYPFPGELMKTDATLVQRVEVIPKVYYYRDMTFDGIVSVFTKGQNFMDIPLLPGMSRVFYQLSENKMLYSPKTYQANEKSARTPDLRSLLHWEAAVSITKGKLTTLSFYTGDGPGEYEIDIAGITCNGEVVKTTVRFWVE